MNLSYIGVDVAKNVCQLHGVDRHSKAVWKRRLRRAQWLQALLDKVEPGCEIGMEACRSAYAWISQRALNAAASVSTSMARRLVYCRVNKKRARPIGPALSCHNSQGARGWPAIAALPAKSC